MEQKAIEHTKQQILESDEFVLSEIKKLQYLYELKRVIRNDQIRTDDPASESVAEHIYSMNILARYFLPLEDSEGKLDARLVHQLILWHEIDEIETGDILGWKKTSQDKQEQLNTTKTVLAKLPETLLPEAELHFAEYNTNVSPEANFVKAVDKLDPAIDAYNPNGKKVTKINKMTPENYRAIKDPYLKDFPYIKRFSDVIYQRFIEESFFS